MLHPSAASGGALAHSTVTVLIADAHPVVRVGLRCLLNECPDLNVVGDGPCAAESVAELAASLNPTIVVVGGPDAVAVASRLRGMDDGRKILVLSASEDAGSVRQAMGAGASGYVLKRSTAEELVQAVRAVAAGGTYLDPAVAEVVVGSPSPADGLSEREVQVLRMIAQGYSNKEIAAKLKLSVKTVETYKARSLEKLGLCSRVDVVRHAVQNGWLHDGLTEVGKVVRDGVAGES